MPKADPDKLIVGSKTCPSCGTTLFLKVNINGCVYAYCNHREEGEEEACFYRETYGKKQSRKIIQAHFEKETKNEIELQNAENSSYTGIGDSPYKGIRTGFFGRIAASLSD